MKSRYIETIQPLLAELTASRAFLAHHSANVAIYAIELARALGLLERDIETLRVAAIFHDIGMAMVPRDVLEKPAALTADERAQVREHVGVGVELASEFQFLEAELPIVRHHHERYDGTGYPDGLAGGRIPVGARILAIADAYEAMVSSRPYRKPLSSREALDELRRGAGTQFDPDMVEAFVRIQSEIISERAPGQPPPQTT